VSQLHHIIKHMSNEITHVLIISYFLNNHQIHTENAREAPESGHVRETEVKPNSIKSLLKTPFCEVGFRAQHEKRGLSSDNGKLCCLKIALELFLMNTSKWD